MKIKRNEPVNRETIAAMGVTCSQCSAERKVLHVFYSTRGGHRRTHNGAFCNKACHDIFHGLKPKPKEIT